MVSLKNFLIVRCDKLMVDAVRERDENLTLKMLPSVKNLDVIFVESYLINILF